MSNTTVSVTLQLRGQQAQSVLNQLNQSQKTTANELLRTNRMIEGVLRQQAQQTRIQSQQLQQLTRLNQQNTQNVTRQNQQTQATLRTNQLLERILQQQTRQTTIQTQQARNQSREYQLQLNMLRQQVAAAERLRQQLEQAGRAGRGVGGGGAGGIGGALNGVAATVGGVTAGGMILNGAFRPAISYDEQLTRMSVIAADGKGVAEMRRQKPELRRVIDQAALSGGSSLEDTAAALDSLLARGKYKDSEAKAILPTISESAYAGNTTAVGMSVLADALATYGLKGDADLKKSFAMALRSGELGGFELKDMQSDLARQLALATSAGYSGTSGLASLLSLNQVSMDVSGNANEAGNNVVNLLQKLGSRELSDSMGKAVTNTEGLATSPAYNKKGKFLGNEFDWNKQLQLGREQGKFGAEVLGDVIDHQLNNNKDYQNLKSQLGSASGDERKKLLSDMSNIALGGEIGKIIADRQFLMAALAQTLARNNIDENGVNRIDGLKNQTLAAEYSQVVTPTVGYLNENPFGKEGTASTNAKIVRQDAFNRVADGYGSALDKFSEITQQFPEFSQGLFLSTTALTALAASAGVASLAMGRNTGPNPGVGPSSGSGRGSGNGSKLSGAAQLLGLGALVVTADDTVTGLFDKAIEKVTGYKSDKRSPMEIYMDSQKEKQSQDNSQMIAQQQAASKFLSDIVNKLNALINVTTQNKPIPMTMPNVGGLLGDISKHAVTEEKRHGAALLTYKP